MKVLMAEAALMLFTSALATEWAFQGIEKMHMVFISLAATSFLQLSLNMIFVKGPDNLLLVPLINFLAAMPIIVFFLHRLGFKPVLRGLDIGKIRCYLSSSIVIWAISVFAQVYNGLDIAILGFFRSPEEVGCFTIARRAIGGVSLLMIFLANALLPHLSSSFGRDTARFNYATRRFLKLSLVMIILVFLPAVIFSKGLISLTVGAEYAPASGPLAIMGMALILVAFNLPFSTGLIAAGMEKEVLKQAAASAALNIVSNFILIPKYGMIGAAISFLLAEALALVWILHVYNKKMKLSERRGDDREKRV
jgi:O-antigen/teichoic acid export membrane protein